MFQQRCYPAPACFRDRLNAELLGEASAIPGCRQGILPGLAPSLQRGVPWGKLFCLCHAEAEVLLCRRLTAKLQQEPTGAKKSNSQKSRPARFVKPLHKSRPLSRRRGKSQAPLQVQAMCSEHYCTPCPNQSSLAQPLQQVQMLFGIHFPCNKAQL